jgi:hypothetical protein
MPLKALLCSGNDTSPQHRSVLRAIHTLNSLKNNIRLLGWLPPIYSTRWSRAEGLMWGTRGPYLLVAVMAGYGCVSQCWQIEANVRSTYGTVGIVKIVYGSIFIYSYLDPSFLDGFYYLSMHSWLSPPIFLPIAIFFVSLCPAILGFSSRSLREKASFA